MDDEEEFLEAGRPALPRPLRIASTVLIVALLVAAFAIRFWPDSNPAPHPAALDTPPPATVTTPSAPPLPGQPAWPTAPSGCGGTTDVPIVASRPPAEHTGLKLLLGGSQLRVVDFENGQVTALPDVAQATDAYVANLSGTVPGYATTMKCSGSGSSRIYYLGPDHSAQYVGNLHGNQSLVADGSQAWIETSRLHGPSDLRPLGNGPLVHLPKQLYVFGAENGNLIGFRYGSNAQSGRLLVLDAATGRIRKTYAGVDAQVGIGAGRLLWSTGCDLTEDRPCRLVALRLADGARREYLLPRPALGGTLSPDGSRVALLVEAEQSQRLDDQHPFPPSQIATLDLRSGQIRFIPNVLVPAKSFPGMSFSADGRWLAIALDAGRSTRLLAWHPGIGRAYEIKPVPGDNYGAPPLAVLPG